MSDFIPELTARKKSTILKSLREMTSLSQFYEREHAVLQQSQFINRFGEDVFASCRANGWLNTSRESCGGKIDRHGDHALCWITAEGVRFYESNKNFSGHG